MYLLISFDPSIEFINCQTWFDNYWIKLLQKHDNLSDERYFTAQTAPVRTEDIFTVADKSESMPKAFERRIPRRFNPWQKPVVEKDVVCLDLEPRARYYYIHVMAKSK